MKPILILLTGHAPAGIRARHGDFSDWFRVAARLPRQRLRIVDAAAGEKLPKAGELAGVFISGAAAMVTDRARWSEQATGWIRDVMDAELPLFGVCFGHQLIAHALGGRVGNLAGGREIGSQSISLLNTPAFDAMTGATPAQFNAHTTHVQSVLELPPDSIVLARSVRDPHQLLRHGPRAVSSQFHPEFSADIMRAYIRYKQADLRQEGVDVEMLFRDVAAAPLARRLLQRFARELP